MRRLVVAAGFVLSACGAAAPTPSTSASPPALKEPVAVVEVQSPSNSVSLVSADGRVVAAVQPLPPPWPASLSAFSTGINPSLVSPSDSRVYYLDGGSTIKFLLPGGHTGTAAHLTVGPRTLAAFAVSPDDRRVAVALVELPADLGQGWDASASVRLYVEDLNGGGHRVDLFSSSTVVVWPVGWHAGQLLVAELGPVTVDMNRTPTQSRSWDGYALLDAATGKRQITFGPDCSDPLFGPALGPTGIACQNDAGLGITDWDGTYVPFPNSTGLHEPRLSPDGSRIAAVSQEQLVAGFGSPAPVITLLSEAGNQSRTKAVGTPIGWIDDSHVLYACFKSCELGVPAGSKVSLPMAILDTTTGAITRVDTHGWPPYFLGVLGPS